MAKKEEFVGIRISKELRAFLEKRAKEKGISLSKLIDEHLIDSFKEDKEFIVSTINKRKQERPVFWKELDKSPIVRAFQDFIAVLYTEFLNPLNKTKPDLQPVVLLGWIHQILKETIKHFDSISEEHRRFAADTLISVGEVLIDGLVFIKSGDKETQEHIIDMKKNLAEKACYYFTALTFAKDSYNKVNAELEKVRNELIKELKEKPPGREV
ncbi:MAG: hypothetical protein HUU09_05520 [Candidatus Jettenia caeni]|nr:hypothetical protein [Candidatus Jettenia caeni]UJS18302.1 MAG: hypothetical protein L3J17_04375 [Candidatus Jettenia sp.]